MAQTDLVAQKILGTDPQVGFGEGSVLPYRQRSLDTRGFEAMERAQTRKQAEEAELQKTNAHFFNERIGKLKESDRMFDALINQKTKEVIEVGTGVIREGKGQLTGDENFNQKYAERNTLADGTMQMRKEYDNVLKADYGDYINKEDVIGAATRNLEKAALDANAGDISAVSRNIKPNENSFEFFKADKFIYDKVKDIKMSEQSTDKRNASGLGEYITTTSNGYKFSTRDANGNIVPGVDKSIVKYFLDTPTTDSDTLRFRDSMNHAANLEIENKALQILQNDPRFKNLRKDQVPDQLNKLKDQISYDQKSPFYEGIDAIKERILRNKLEPFQESKEKTEIKQGFKYPVKDGGSGDGSKDKFKMEPTIISQNSGTGNTVNMPGVVVSHNNKPLPLIVAANMIYDWGTGKRDLKNTDRVPVKATSIGYALANKTTEKILAFKDVDETVNYINTAPLKDIKQLNLGQYIFGNIEEKKTTEGDTGEDDAYDKYAQNVNRTIAIPYNKNNETGAQINSLSGGAFNERTPTNDEQRVLDAWNKRTSKKESKPLTVVQNGHTYTLNPNTGQYE